MKLQCADGDTLVLLPPGTATVEGAYNHLTHRLDLATGQVVPYTPPPPAPEVLAAQALAERNRRLDACTWVLHRAADRGEPVPEPWSAYRRALRDLELTAPEIAWPMPPAA